MSLSRKKLSQDEASGILFDLFESRFDILFSEISTQTSLISNGDLDYVFDDTDARERALDLWIACAARLSQLRQSGEAAEMTKSLLNVYRQSGENHDILALTLSELIISSYKNDDKLFHNVSYEIFSKLYPSLGDFIKPYGHDQIGRYEVTGLELASCLRAVDFVLKDFKLADSAPPPPPPPPPESSPPAYNRDYIIGSICSIIDMEIDESGPELFGQGKLVISNKFRSIGWIGPSATPRDGDSLLLDLDKIPSDEKTLLNIMLQSVAGTEGMAKTVAVDMAAMLIHQCLMKVSELYKKLDYQDPRLRTGELDSKEKTSSGSTAQLEQIPQSQTGISPADFVRLEQITSLRDRGTLSQSQFEMERNIILGAAEPIGKAADAPPAISPPPPPPPPPPAIPSTAATSVQRTKGTNVGFIAVMLLPFLLMAVVIFGGATESSSDEEPAIASDVASEELSTVSDTEEFGIDTSAVSSDRAVANCYGSYERKNWSAAFVYCSADAEQGDADAQNKLGSLYDAGRGVAKDNAEAVRWYRKAADQGGASAQYNLGVMYDEGEGVTEDDAEAVRWYRKAADQGRARAQYNLGVMYDEGEGVTEDDAEAVRWYRKAAAQGDADAKKRVAELGY